MPSNTAVEDPHGLRRFLAAQEGVWEQALRELRNGEKRTHWMWFVFPQMRGLGHSSMAEQYGIAGAEEARAYAAHPVLGERLRQGTQAVLDANGRPVAQIFGYPDDLKFHSSMTLFAETAEADALFVETLKRCFGGRRDAATLALLHASTS